MMADVIDMTKRRLKADAPYAEETVPHIQGPCRCGACQHEWEGAAPVGVVHTECPNCHRFWGVFKNAIEPDQAWRCNCGEQLFWLTPTGAMCRRCGLIATSWAE